jgi:hypothetical protein
MSWRASSGVRFIFKFPASIFLRIALSPSMGEFFHQSVRRFFGADSDAARPVR